MDTHLDIQTSGRQATQLIERFSCGHHIMFAYWGSRGAIPQFALDMARTAGPDLPWTFSISTSNELFEKYRFLDRRLFPVVTFQNKKQFLNAERIRKTRQMLRERLIADNTRVFVSLMPHVWSPFIAPVLRELKIKHIVIVHDVARHPGDITSLANWWLFREAAAADHIITLSKFVRDDLIKKKNVTEHKVTALFHPDLNYGRERPSHDNHHGNLRALFFGRMMSYKGLGIFTDAIEILRHEGIRVEVGVFGKGKIRHSVQTKLTALGAEVEKRWIGHDEFRSIFSRYDFVVAAHTQASQSGVIAAALGAGLPVVATPTGGLVEQVRHGQTGLIAESATAHGLAGAVRKLVENRSLLAQFGREIAATREERSTERFTEAICSIAHRTVDQGQGQPQPGKGHRSLNEVEVV